MALCIFNFRHLDGNRLDFVTQAYARRQKRSASAAKPVNVKSFRMTRRSVG